MRDTIATVFRQHAYDRTIQARSLLGRLVAEVIRWLGQLYQAAAGSSGVRAVILTLVVAAVTLLAARLVLSILSGDLVLARGRTGLRLGGSPGDPLSDAERLAAAGNYTDAAHALYAALLASLAERERVRVHPSKTVGDYARELRRRSSALMTPFREFARSYEVVVYGIGSCDRPRYERLYALASGMLPRRT